MSTGRSGPTDWSDLRERIRAFYAYAFLPPSVTNDEFGSEPRSETGSDSFGGFGFTDWLDAGRPTGPQKPPAEPRVVTEATATTGVAVDSDPRFEFVEWLDIEEGDLETATTPTPEPATVDREFGEFDFDEWLDSGEGGFEPASVREDPVDRIEEPTVPDSDSGSTLIARRGLKPHPAKAATYALFLAVLTLAVLSVVGYAPVLGPATGLGG